jgi:hypothetical protein
LTYLASVALFIVGLNVGISFPDLDQRLPLLLHRSLLTHGLFILKCPHPVDLFHKFRVTLCACDTAS